MVDATCSIDTCTRPSRARGLCTTHYSRWRETRLDAPLCQHPDCQGKARVRGLCTKHYSEWRRQSGLAVPSSRSCSEPGCAKTLLARGKCNMHYRRWRKEQRIVSDVPCSVEGCTEPRWARGWCTFHYSRWNEAGDPTAPFVNKVVGKYTDAHRCKSPGCTRKVRVNGRCHQCNKQLKYGATAHELAERDGTDCSICGKPVDMTLNRNVSMMGPSVDHVIPRSRGGSDDPDNLALAHLICNISKGNRVSGAK